MKPDFLIELCRDTKELIRLSTIPSLVDQVSTQDHKREMQPVRALHEEAEIRRLLLKRPILGIHPKLRIGALQKDKTLRPGSRETQKKEK